MATTMTLAEKVWSIITVEDDESVRAGLRALPDVGRLNDFERDLRDWGMVYGVALGLARAEDMWEPLESVTARAREAAVETFLQWSGDFPAPIRSIDPLVDDVLLAHEYDEEGDHRLQDAVIALGNRLGWPTKATVTA